MCILCLHARRWKCFHVRYLCTEIRESMSPLKHKDVITLRADIARTANEVRNDKKEVLQLLSKLRAQVF